MTSLRRTVIKLVIFAVVSIVITVSVIATLLDLKIGQAQSSYHAIFTNATGLQPGDIVRVAGIEVGKVKGVTLDHDRAKVDFSLATDQHLTTTTEASIDFQNLLGQRYLALDAGAPGGTPLKAGATIPTSRTRPGLDLTTVFTGFQPLLAALNPGQVNELTASIIAVLQGQSGAVDNLVSKTAQLTTNLAQRSDVIDEVLDNLTPLLTRVNTSDGNIGQLINGLNGVVRSLNADGGQSLDRAVTGANALAANTSRLISGSQPYIDQDLAKLRTTTGILEDNEQPLNSVLANLTPFLNSLNKVADNGSYLSVYFCDLTINVSGPISVNFSGSPSTQSEPVSVPTGVVADRAYHFGVCS